MTKLINDLATVTGLSKLSLEDLSDKSQACICHAIKESLVAQNPITEVDVGIGVLYIKIDNDEVKYKFILSKKFDNNVSFTVMNKESPLIIDLDKSLKLRIEKAYKGLF